ncbi:MAG: PilX N-terminal domain-containing pilus assembly protein [Pseudomonadota bacterium]
MKTLRIPLLTTARRQRGVALITGLILMVVLTLLTIAAMRTTTLEELMARNARDRDLAFQAAEAALRAGEEELNGAVPPTLVAGTGRTPRITDGSRPEYWANTHPWATQSVAMGWQPQNTSAAPRYVIEFFSTGTGSGGGLGFGPMPGQGIYRITARGVGSSANTVVILQSVYEM